MNQCFEQIGWINDLLTLLRVNYKDNDNDKDIVLKIVLSIKE